MTALAQQPLDSKTDDQLMGMIRSGDAEDALRAIERRHGRDVRRLVQSIVRDPSLASDLAAEVLEKVWLERMRYEPGTNFRAWLLGVARNHALTALRAKRRASRVGGAAWGGIEPDDIATVRTDPKAVAAEEMELNEALSAAVAELPEHYKTVFTMCVQQNRPYSEVSRALHLPKGTIAISIRRARRRLFGSLAHRLEPAHVAALTSHYATCA